MNARHLTTAAAALLAVGLVGPLAGSAQEPGPRTITLKENERTAIFRPRRSPTALEEARLGE